MAEETCHFRPVGLSRNGPQFQFTSLKREQRTNIVNRTAFYRDPTAAPAHANLFTLSALGASLDIEGHWEDSVGNPLQEWRQVTSQGRDHYVRIVERGYLFPTGHQAVRVDIVERVFAVDPVHRASRVTAYLRKRSFIRVTRPLKAYPAPGQAFEGRGWPLTSVLVANEVSPMIKEDLEKLIEEPEAGFPIQADNGEKVRWKLVGTDPEGNRLAFLVPLVFVPGPRRENPDSVYDETYARRLADKYNAVDPDDRTGDSGGSPLRYAPEEAGRPGATTHPTVTITLGAATTVSDPNTTASDSGIDRDRLVGSDQPAFYPSLARANIRLPAVDTLAKNQATSIGIHPYHRYVEEDLTPEGNVVNAGKVYAQAVVPQPLQFAGEAVGAVAKPDFAVTGLSAVVGPVGGSIDRYADVVRVDPAEYFSLGSAKLLGGLELKDIVGEMAAPTIVELKEPVASPGVGDALGLDLDVARRTVRYHLEAPLKTLEGVFEPKGAGRLFLDVTAVFPAEGEPTFDVDGRIDPFVIHILPGGHFIDIPFNRFHFHTANGAKPDVDVDVGDVVFVGALAFVNELAGFLKVLGESGLLPEAAAGDRRRPAVADGPTAAAEAQGPSSGPFVNVSPTGVDAGTSVALPAIVSGVFNMQNLALTAGVHIPFTESPAAARFSFSSREHPFLLTVMAFGGGGFVGLGVGLDQVELVEASLEFGAQIAFDIGVASGGVTVTGGVYFKFEATEGVELTGFVRITGALEVLGLVAISAEFNLALTYRPKPDSGRPSSVSGTATLRVEIDLAFFSVAKDLTVTKEFAGGDPTFRDMVPDQPTWAAYCDAFAA